MMHLHATTCSEVHNLGSVSGPETTLELGRINSFDRTLLTHNSEGLSSTYVTHVHWYSNLLKNSMPYIIAADISQSDSKIS